MHRGHIYGVDLGEIQKKGVAVMGILLGQLPPAEIARLKAELAEMLIANFCYPRFYDYRTNSLRMRPVDRARRQEVWLYLSSIDFAAWNRMDMSSPDFQRQIERLVIYFVQRNRNFFGQQGRKRMADVRMLISSCALMVVEGLREHLTGRQSKNSPPFGSPRPVPSWATTNASGHPEAGWEQIVSTTMLLQQQLQEIRGEIKVTPVSEVHAVPGPSNIKRPARGRPAENGAGAVEYEVVSARQVPVPQAEVEVRATSSPALPLYKSTAPLAGSTPSSVRKAEMVVPPIETPTLPIPIADRSAEASVPQALVPEQVRSAPTAMQTRGVSQVSPGPATGVATGQDKSVVAQVNEDVAIFEQLRHQLVLWLRIEAVRSGLDIAGQTPLQLLELLRQQRIFDETRLQIISTLLSISNQVIKNGQANLLDYKQGLMFYLIHTKK